MKEKLLADLRNKLSPMKNYFSMNRDLEAIKSEEDSFLKGYNMTELEDILKKEAIVCETAMAQIVYIIECLENL